jgi:methylmalonyl-CoA mutase
MSTDITDITLATAATSDLALAGEFPQPARQDWEGLVARVLGASWTKDDGPPDQKLATVTADNIVVAPLYTADDAIDSAGYPGQAPFVRGRTAAGHRAGWDVRQRHGHPDPKVAREEIMEDLYGGVSSVWLLLGGGYTPVASLPDVLTEVYLDLATVVLDAGGCTREAADLFLSTAKSRGVPDEQLLGVLGADPLGLSARTGDQHDLADAVELAGRCVAGLPNVRALVVDALPFHESGATDAEELGCSLAAGVEYLRALEAVGIPLAAAFGQLEFRYAATADQFATIVKTRAARRTWAAVAAGCGVSAAEAGQRQHFVTSWTMTTRRDPWNNILRATLASFSAGVGGADALTVLPFDVAIGLPDPLARRVARNTHALLLEESHVARVIDPAGGSWYVEKLTEQLGQAAWQWFQEIERAGGLRAALNSGMVADRIEASRERRLASLAHGRAPITGVSTFPPQGDTVLEREPAAEPPSGGLARIRWAQWHEAMRERSDAFVRTTGAPAKVGLLRCGSARGSSVRADFVAGLLAPAGVSTTPTDPADASTIEPVVALCCADDADPGELAETLASLRAAGVVRVLMAGAADVPLEVDERLTKNMDALAFQHRILLTLGVEL